MERKEKKIVVVGVEGVGKTSLIVRMDKNSFSKKPPRVSENCYIESIFKRQRARFSMWDTEIVSEHDGINNLRKYMYPGSSLIFVCFSVVHFYNLDDVVKRWIPELRKEGMNKVPKFLVGLKIDLRNDEETLKQLDLTDRKPIMKDQVLNHSIMSYFEGYFECSSKNGEGVKELIQESTELMFGEKYKKSEYCSII